MSTATLAGVTLLAKKEVGWRFTQGFTPYTRVFEISKKSSASLLAASGGKGSPTPVTLAWSRKGKSQTVKNLYVLRLVPVDHPDRIGALVVDVRYWWNFRTVVRQFNVRRRSGEYRLVAGSRIPIPPVADIKYARFSLQRDEKTSWDARGMVADVTAEVTGGAFSLAGADFSKAVTIEGLLLRDKGSSAMERVCAFVPGLTFWIDENGVAQATMRSGGGEELEIRGAGPPIVGPGLSAQVDYSRVRPSRVDVYFQCEDEMRFDFLEGIAYTTVLREPRTLDNVLRLPDTITYVSGARAGQKIVANTWVPIDQDLFNAWNQDVAVVSIPGRPDKTLLPISFALIQRLWLAPGGYHAYVEASVRLKGNVWALRWGAIKSHYRQTYRLPRRWVDRCHSFSPTRLSILDPTLGLMASPDVYSDHALIPPISRVAFQRGARAVINILAWPIGDANRFLDSATLCESVTMAVQDPDAFVFHLTYAPEKSQVNTVQDVLPCALSDKANGDATALPSQDPRTPLGGFLLHSGRLAVRHRLSTVITMAPASPQGLKGFYKISVSPDQAKTVLPPSIARGIGPCMGPPLQVVVGSQIAKARSVWKDTDAAAIESAILDGGDRSPARILDPQHLQEVAFATAAAAYSASVDRREGSRVTAFNPLARPVGRVSSVNHSLGPRGVFTTEWDMSPDVQPIDMMSLLSENTRRKLFRKVQE